MAGQPHRAMRELIPKALRTADFAALTAMKDLATLTQIPR